MPPRFKEPYCSAGCPVEAALGLIGGKWKGIALYHLMGGTLRFNEIRRRIPGVTQRMLTTQLRELEADGLIVRVVYPEVPPRVEYSLSVKGRTLEPVIMALKSWGEAHARAPQSQAAEAAA
ncbi:winged helix-turn-helix transcriptional regulator [Bosea sp. UC22_33]|uniref:winged helix-turn-helix transcriptional regulator n=1 Tax=Bosea sp. UC22_33 TaxID=3350165 RepID=UPI00366D9281